eukprot:TRINITY_DN57279_c0_g1_i1.p1 TRINITY_DN57279_c0_g1~~TRINITY_DN57279_c0_g1_i1.p1  ORF type:complete len:279 (-),score=44.53 TRINITY_DN57279_c0_g1_i1:137-904(-)
MTSHAELLAGVLAIAGSDRATFDGTASVKLVIVCAKSVCIAAIEASSESMEQSALQQRIDSFNARWDKRPFSFSGSMETLVGTAVVSAARTVFATARSTDPASLPVVFDMCCGSGTLSAAAVAQGAPRVVGLEIRGDFIPRILENFEHAGVSDRVELLNQDCTQPIKPSSSGAPVPSDPGLVLCNAPWGKKFGTEADCELVLRGVIEQYPRALLCFIAPKAIFDRVRMDFSLEVLACIPVGHVHFIAVQIMDSTA